MTIRAFRRRARAIAALLPAVALLVALTPAVALDGPKPRQPVPATEVTTDGSPTTTAASRNRKPVLDDIPNRTVPAAIPIEPIPIESVDPDGDLITITAGDTLPPGLVLTDHGDGTATITGVPAVDAAGRWAVSITADDGAGSRTRNFKLIVTPSTPQSEDASPEGPTDPEPEEPSGEETEHTRDRRHDDVPQEVDAESVATAPVLPVGALASNRDQPAHQVAVVGESEDLTANAVAHEVEIGLGEDPCGPIDHAGKVLFAPVLQSDVESP